MVFPPNSGICLPGASVEVVIDGGAVQSGTHTEACDGWDAGGGIYFYNLPVAEITLRARAAGYMTREISVMPSVESWITPTFIELQRQPTMEQERR